MPGRSGDLVWTPVADAPIDISAAHRLAADGLLIMASKHYSDSVVLVVRASKRAVVGEKMAAD
jgi:hypothetical protein